MIGYWVILHIFCRLLIFSYKINFFRKNLSRMPSESQTVLIQIRPDILSGLIFVKTVCISYLQTKPVGKELKLIVNMEKYLFYISIFRISFPRNVTQNMFVLIKIHCKCIFLQVNLFMPGVHILKPCRHKQSSTTEPPP